MTHKKINKTKDLMSFIMQLDRSITDHQKQSIEAILNQGEIPLLPKLLNQSDVAKLLGVSRQTVYNLKKADILKTTKLTPSGNDRYFSDQITKLTSTEVKYDHED